MDSHKNKHLHNVGLPIKRVSSSYFAKYLSILPATSRLANRCVPRQTKCDRLPLLNSKKTGVILVKSNSGAGFEALLDIGG
jgi:hypothetical protein